MTKTKILIIALIAVSFFTGYLMRGCGQQPQQHDKKSVVEDKDQVAFWTCSMHPQIKQPKPGLCPICAMELIPVSSSEQDQDASPWEYKISSAAKKLAEIQTAPVERKFISAEIRMDGKVEYDETRLAYITAWVPGRIDRLYVDYTGMPVQKGDHLVSLYSPELLTTQQELLLGVKMLKSRPSESTRKNVEATREKLRLWGLTEKQIGNIEKRGKTSDHTTIFSPISGIVVHKNGFEGMYVKTGTRIYTVADLSHVWIKLDAYESDLMWVRSGQEVEFETKAYPGETFKGQITFIDPVLNPKTRTVKVRVNVANPKEKLKPDMFVTARVYPRVAAGGKSMASSMTGKWVCPMHPEIVKEKKGDCDICGMPLVAAEALGYGTADVSGDAPLVIPVTAPLITGKRAVVYVEMPDEKGGFAGREVVLGPRAGKYYIVKSGLEEGDRVVVNGNFKLDSALQIMAKPSMMSPERGVSSSTDMPEATSKGKKLEKLSAPAAFKAQIDQTISAYYKIHKALSQDKYVEAVDGARQFINTLKKVDMKLLKGKAHLAWMDQVGLLKKHAVEITMAKDITAVRAVFSPLSDALFQVAKQFGTANQTPVYRFHCPMAFDNKGAYWLQSSTETENPYYGGMMYRCGDKTDTISTGTDDLRQEEHAHE